MTDEFYKTIEQRLEVLRAERERIVQEYQKQLDTAVAPYNAAIGELEQLLERLESNHTADARQGADGAKKPRRRHGARSGARSGAKENVPAKDETIPKAGDVPG